MRNLKLTGKERMMGIMKGEPVDRPAVKLWGLEAGLLRHPGYQPVYDAAINTADIFCSASSPFDFIVGNAANRYEKTRRFRSEEWTEEETILHTPEGDLSSIQLINNFKKPGYIMTHFAKEPNDFKRILSIEEGLCKNLT